jgi:hypothetical protein
MGVPKKLIEIDEFLPIIITTGILKNSLPFHLRGWLGILGLHIQYRSFDTWEALAAGGHHIAYFEAVNPDPDNFDAWKGNTAALKIRKFNKKVWQSRFAHLVIPTSDVAFFVSGGNPYIDAGSQFTQESVTFLNQTVKYFKTTGDWPSLPSGRVCFACGLDLTSEEWHNKLCSHCGNNISANGTRSCEQCKCGPNIFACLKGETGMPPSFEPFILNTTAPSPIKYHLSNSSQMFCFKSNL